MNTINVRLGPKYQVVIPKQVREALSLQPSDSLMFIVQDKNVILRARPASFTGALKGLGKQLWQDVDADQWLDEDRSAWD